MLCGGARAHDINRQACWQAAGAQPEDDLAARVLAALPHAHVILGLLKIQVPAAIKGLRVWAYLGHGRRA